MGYAPDSLYACYDEIHKHIPSAINAGIYGDQNGYHGSRQDQYDSWPNDYSIQQADDQWGDKQAGGALDVTMYDDDVITAVTKRLVKAIDQDGEGKPGGRLYNLREFFGTVDGINVTGRDCRGGYPVTSDDSHLFHVHLSFYRGPGATDMQTAMDVAAVFTGQASAGGTGDDDMGELKQSSTGQTQELSTDGPKTLWVNDEKGVSLCHGPCTFHSLVQVSVEGLPAGKALSLRYTLWDVPDDGGEPTLASQFPITEIIGTSGSTFGQASQYGDIADPKNAQRRLRVQASTGVDGVAVTRVAVHTFVQPA